MPSPSPEKPAGRDRYRPPSNALTFQDGVWRSRRPTAVSYPDEGNDLCFAVEDGSYWFRHRNDVITTIIGRYPPSGTIYDVGGGNGFVSLALEAAGHSVVLVEPGAGAANAVRRGVTNVIHGTLEDAGFDDATIDAVGVFDVVEHIEDDDRFLADCGRILVRGGRVYCTVPAVRWLWSGEDVAAGHFRRYTRSSLRSVFQRNGFDVEYLTPFFSWLPLPILLFRTLPYHWGSERTPKPGVASVRADHSLPRPLQSVATSVHRWELARIARGSTVPCGTSLFCVARCR